MIFSLTLRVDSFISIRINMSVSNYEEKRESGANCKNEKVNTSGGLVKEFKDSRRGRTESSPP